MAIAPIARKARLKYVLDGSASTNFLTLVEAKLGRRPAARARGSDRSAPDFDRLAAISACTRKSRTRLSWLGVALHARTTDARAGSRPRRDRARFRRWRHQAHRLAESADLRRSGRAVDEALARSRDRPLDEASPIRAGLVACTGNAGCTLRGRRHEEHAEEIADQCEPSVAIDTPINIHVTGCRHSCAQHYIGDIGLVGARVPINDEGDTVEGYHIVVGGGFGADARDRARISAGIGGDDAPSKSRACCAPISHARRPRRASPPSRPPRSTH